MTVNRPQPAARPVPPIALAAIALWLAVQIALPLRAGLFATEVRWSGDGHLFSWRMRIYDRRAEGEFRVTAAGEEWIVDPEDFLTARQASKMLVRPDMIHQFAQALRQGWEEAGYRNVEVRARIAKSLNGRPMQDFVDPGVDLASVRAKVFGADDWVLARQHDVWGLADNRMRDIPPSAEAF